MVNFVYELFPVCTKAVLLIKPPFLLSGAALQHELFDDNETRPCGYCNKKRLKRYIQVEAGVRTAYGIGSEVPVKI